jgi:hypothetical protein
MARPIVRSISNAIVLATLLGVVPSTLLRAESIDCGTLDAVAAAGVLGVPKAKSNPSQGHHTESPDNMDVFACGYVEISPDPMARTLLYFVYTPIPKDLASVYSSVSNPNIPGKPLKFSPGVGSQSTGWVRSSANGEAFDGSIVFLGATQIVSVKVGGMPSADAAKAALISAGKLLAKS